MEHTSEAIRDTPSLPADFPRATPEEFAAPEMVKCAALHLGDKLYWGVTHSHITMGLSDPELDAIGNMPTEALESARLFVTTHDRIVSIDEGYKIAELAHQIDDSDEHEPNAEYVHGTMEGYRKAA